VSRIKSICLWCGKDHKSKKPAKCKDASVKASSLIEQGVPMWVLMAVLHRHGLKALDDFEVYGAMFLKTTKRKGKKGSSNARA
jgi:hypothetical protein